MHLAITVKMIPESQEELQEHLPAQVEEVKNHFNELAKEGVLGPPNQVEVRYLISANEWQKYQNKEATCPQ